MKSNPKGMFLEYNTHQYEEQQSQSQSQLSCSQIKSIFQTSIEVLDTLLQQYEKTANIKTSSNGNISLQLSNIQQPNGKRSRIIYNNCNNPNYFNSFFQHFYKRLKTILSQKSNQLQNQQIFLDSLFVDDQVKQNQNIKNQLKCDQELYQLVYDMKNKAKQQAKQVRQLKQQINQKNTQLNSCMMSNKEVMIKSKHLQSQIEECKQTQKQLIQIQVNLIFENQQLKFTLEQKQRQLQIVKASLAEKSKNQDKLLASSQKCNQYLRIIANLQNRLQEKDEAFSIQRLTIEQMRQENKNLFQQIYKGRLVQSQLNQQVKTQISNRIQIQKSFVKHLWMFKNQGKQNKSHNLSSQLATTIQDKLKDKQLVSHSIKKQLSLFIKNASTKI